MNMRFLLLNDQGEKVDHDRSVYVNHLSALI